MKYMMRKILLCSFFLMLCLSGICTAETSQDSMYYPRGNLVISHGLDEIPNDDSRPLIEEQIVARSLVDEVQYGIIASYSDMIGIPPTFISETLAILFILLGAGGLTFLLTRWKLPEDPNSRPRILLNTIREHPGATQSELQKLTGHSRGSVSVNLHHLGMASKIRKSVQNGKTRYYLACTPDDEMKGFLRKLTTQENPQKILEAIISNPGISQKELHETTGIPKTTLQWHLSQLAKYEAIKSTRERNTVHYSVIPDLVLLYNNALEETKQNNTSTEEKEPDNNKES